MAIKRHVLLPRSSKQGSKPTADSINYGELTVNYNAEHEFIATKNSNGDIITFSSDNSQDGLWKKGTGESAVKLDTGATASGKLSVAEGKGTSAQGEDSHAEGMSTTASGAYSHAEGNGTTASGDSSHAEGVNATASGKQSHAEGGTTKAIGSSSHAEGGGTTASGDCSHAEGYGTKAIGVWSHAEGYISKASGLSSHAEGANATASGNCSHAEGENTTASGNCSHAEGSETTASGDSSHAEGYGTITTNIAEHACGKYNQSNPNQIYSIGVGTDNEHRRNAIMVMQNGDTSISGGTLNVSGDTHFHGPYNYLSGTTIIENLSATPTTFDDALSETSINAVQNSAVTKVIIDNEKVTAASLNDLNDRKLDYSGVTTDTAMTYTASSASGVKLSHTKKTAITDDKLKVIKTDDFGHIIGARDVKASDIAVFDDALSETSVNAVQNSAVTKVIFDNEKVTAASLNDLNDRKLDYSGITTDSAMTYTASSASGVKLSHTKRTVLNDNVNLQNTDTKSNGKLKVIKTDGFGHVIDSRDATAADIEGLGVASKGLKITYGSVQTLANIDNNSWTRDKERTYDGKTVMSFSIPQKITDLEGGTELAYVHLSGDTMTGNLKLGVKDASSTNITENIVLEHDTGKITAKSFYQSSDKRLKYNIKDISDEDIEKAEAIKLKSFNFKSNNDFHYGVIAQDLEEKGLNDIVTEKEDGYKSVDYISLLVLKVAALEKEIKDLKDKLNK